MDTSSLRRSLWALASVLSLTFSSLAAAEPPSRAARLGFIGGTVSFSPAGQPDWVQAAVNRPLTTGDRLWTGSSSRAELQIGGAAIRMGPATSMVLLNLDDHIAQVQLSQGTLRIRVRHMGPRQTFEVATPNLAFTLRRPGEYRIEVDPNDDATIVVVENGEAEVYGEGASYSVDSSRAYRFYGTDLSDYDILAARRDDDLDRWSRERDRRADNSVSARYVSTEVVGYEDLDANGTWRVDPTHGNVWVPDRVPSGWTPYRDGHWSWVDPWGWTWVDDAPWGYAVSHYGRWANINGSWAWVPGPRRERAVYAPALVAFVGGKNFQVSVSVGSAAAGAVGWFPLAPREVYQPSYPVSRGYFDNINRSNAVIPPTTITNVYNTTVVNNVTNITNVTYANQQVTGAVVAVPTQAFVQSHPVAKAVVQLPREAVATAPVVRVAAVAPVQQSVQGGAHEAVTKPPVHERVIVARTTPPPAPVPFAAQQAQLAAKPGAPIDEAQRAQLKPAAPAAVAPKISVVAAAPAPTPTARPPATPPAAKSPEERKAVAAKAAVGGAPDAEKAAAAKAAEAKAAEAKAAEAKAAATKAATTAEALKAEESKAAAAQADAAKADAAKAAAAKAATANADAAKAASAKADAAKLAETKAAEAKADAIKASNAKAEAAKADEAKAEKARADAAKADASKAEAAKAEAQRAEAAKVAAARAEAAKAEAARAEAGRAEAAKAAMAKAEAAKADAARAEAARAEAAKAGQARAEAAKAESAKADAARADAVKAARAKAEADKAEAVKAAAAAALAKEPPGAVAPPKPRASNPKSDSDPNTEDEKKKEKEGHKQ